MHPSLSPPLPSPPRIQAPVSSSFAPSVRADEDDSQLRLLLGITPDQTVVFERFSDSAGGYITLDPNSPQVFKTLIRAAKAKSTLR